MLNSQMIANDKAIQNHTIVISESDTLEVFEQLAVVTAACTVTLPDVAAARGRLYAVYSEVAGNVTIQDNGDDAGMDDITLTAADDWALLYSTGRKWLPVGYEIAGTIT